MTAENHAAVTHDEGSPPVRCGGCGRAIDERADLSLDQRQPCPNCGSKVRRFNRTASDRLNIIDSAYQEATAASSSRIGALIDEARAVAKAEVATGRGEAHDARVETRSRGEGVALTGALIREQGEATRLAVVALIDVVKIGQSEAAASGAKLNDLTVSLVGWTKVIGIATLIAVVIAVIAILNGG